jgi:5-methylcytosine-specific restriction endonuclease McrA
MEARTLVLTRSYLPHQIVSWADAMTKVVNGKAMVLEVHASDESVLATIPEGRVRDFAQVARAYPSYAGGDLCVRIPSVMRLTDWDGSVKRGVKFSRINVFTRDQFRCQYCSKQFGMRELNYDHVIPRDRGGKTVWDNIVTSCYPCNSFKGNRTPEQAGMKLRKQPVKPKTLPIVCPKFDPKGIMPSWIPYFGSALADYVTDAA